MKLSNNIVLIIKCTRACNLKCVYCKDRRKSIDSIQISILASAINDFLNLKQDITSIKFIFHGGEPLLLGKEFFDKVLIIQKLSNKKDIPITNIIQTNGTLINDDWCKYFIENHIQIGVSLDGPSELHNSLRPFSQCDFNSFSKVIEGLNLLSKYDIPFGVLSVITESHFKTDPKDFYNFLLTLPTTNFSLLLLQPSLKIYKSKRKEYINYLRKYSSFLSDITDSFLKSDNPELKIREISCKIDTLLGNKSTVCTEGGYCSGKYFGLDINGKLGLCDSFFNNVEFIFGDLRINKIETFINKANERISEIEHQIRNKCNRCKWYQVCKGGCLYDAIGYYQALDTERQKFCPNKSIYAKISKKLYNELSPLIMTDQ